MPPEDATDIIFPLTLGRSLWAIRPDALPRIVEAHRNGRALAAALGAAATARAARRDATQHAGGGVAVIPLTGVITPRDSFLSLLFGGGSGGLQGFRDDFRTALGSPDVGSIVLDIDSPGGLIDLVPETAAEIRAARGDKPIIAVANTQAASAAYWLASQADELVVTPSGDVGSVGVYMLHEDWSGFNEKQGIAPTYISAGRYKTEGNPDAALSDDAQKAWQQEVNDLYSMFVEAVAAGRDVSASTVRDGYGEGRTLLADRALNAGMVDRIATLETVVGEQLGGRSTRAGASALSAARRARAEVTPPPAGDETDPTRSPGLPVDPTHVPDDAPELDPPAPVVEPDDPEPAPEPGARQRVPNPLLV
jgi:signal peptide peptidase SppA